MGPPDSMEIFTLKLFSHSHFYSADQLNPIQVEIKQKCITAIICMYLSWSSVEKSYIAANSMSRSPKLSKVFRLKRVVFIPI